MTITSEVLIGISTAFLAVLMEYTPGLDTWYAKLDPQRKKLVMLGLLALVTLGIFGLSCGGYVDGPTCDDKGFAGLVYLFVIAITANQGVHLISKRSS